ncbi:hypothetical protein [Vagococcus fluvialis]|uniref:hypothetical protein n=1 Tax=Vagococcus fluvialis TaxID=2738 RepID=UPI002033E67D|nr:hypothetical protein [Vagococcus fluvialis]MCM2138932.1 hypothetical protein [Vagococcus fluvialis]
MSKETKKFLDKKGEELIIVMNKTNIVLESGKDFEGFNLSFDFDKKTFEEVREVIINFSNKVWSSFNPKEATSEGSDYYEYYDKTFDNNGYLSTRDYWLSCERPVKESLKLYQLNKRKAESLVFDLLKE